MPRPGPWTLDLALIPPSVNHMYGNRRDGGKYLTEEAKALREQVQMARDLVGFRPTVKGKYSIQVLVTFPDDSYDLDNVAKFLGDAIVGARRDHRVYRWVLDKRVVPGQRRTCVWIEEMP